MRRMASNSSVSDQYKFLTEPPDALKCLICLEVAREPLQHGRSGCGRLFCSQCLDAYGINKPCPHCRMMNPYYFEDSKSKREIKLLDVECDNVDRGCEWKGTVGTLVNHLSTCGFTLIECPNCCEDENGETEMIMKKDLDQHMVEECPNRDYMCEYCGEEGAYAEITQVHDEKCELKMIPCTNDDCAAQLQRREMYRHVRFKCKHTVTACKHQNIGCEVRLKRKDMAAHERDDTLHLHMAINTISLLKEQCSGPSVLNGEYTTFRLCEYQAKKRNGIGYHLPSFYSSRNGYYMKLKVYANGNDDGKGTHLSLYVYCIEGKNDSELEWPFVGTATITILNQERNEGHYQKTVKFDKDMNVRAGTDDDNRGYPRFIPHSILESNSYLKNDSVYFRVSVNAADHKPWLE